MKRVFAAATVLGCGFCVAVPSASPKSNLGSLSAVPIMVLQQQSDSKDQPQKFLGTVISMNGDRFVLRDDVNDVWYHLDDQKQAGKYLGKRVQVTGTLDARADEILVQSIQVEKS